ncbi:glycosyltransferase family 9 protein [Bordetella flabilis]|nr:glycosyltransferase family 9 protein [Bordetella flabilis]
MSRGARDTDAGAIGRSGHNLSTPGAGGMSGVMDPPGRAGITAPRVAVFRALNLADMLCAVPAFRALRKRLPGADIALVGLPWARAFQTRYAHYLDRFFEFPGYPGLPEATARPDDLDAFFACMHAQRFDRCLQLHGAGPTSNRVVAQFGGREAVGLGNADDAASVRVWPYPSDRHEVRRTLYLLEQYLDADVSDERLEFPLLPADRAELHRYPDLESCTHQPYVCLQPGGRDSATCWPPRYFAQVGDVLAARGLRVILTGSQGERLLAQKVAAQMRHPACIAACDMSLGGHAALLSRARLLVSNDTEVAQLSAALHVPSVVVFLATDPLRWGPPAGGPHRVVGGSAMPEVPAVLDSALALLEEAYLPDAAPVP